MSKPFPIPKTFDCPYCGEISRRGNLDEHDLVHCSHTIKEKVRVGKTIIIELTTLHQFVVKWKDDKWQTVDIKFSSSKACEKVEVITPSGWRSCEP